MNQTTANPATPYVRTLLERLRTQRLVRNWSQAEMARRAGISEATYQNLENGFGNPTLTNLLRVLGVLGLSHRLADLVPEPDVPQTLESVHKDAGKVRLRATGRPRTKRE